MLEDIFDLIVPEVESSILHTNEFAETALSMMEIYVSEDPTLISEPDFHETMLSELTELIRAQFGKHIPFYELDELDEVLEELADLFYHTVMPERSRPESIIICETIDFKRITGQINILRNKPQPVQRTPEWYLFRHNLITASNAYKAFEEGSQLDQLIFEKCQPLHIPEASDQAAFVNVNTTLHWGQKYEPLSVMIYEHMYKTKIEDFGCIQHEKYPFLGASPDGINVDPENPRYGRMLEIKNIVNREIDGIPKLEYWIQMQLQMETCNLDECDFLETKFTEYENEQAYFADVEPVDFRGVIMYFSEGGRPVYKYSPLNQTEEDLMEWEGNMMEEHGTNKTWIKNCYWKAEKVSCVLVERNRFWFTSVIGQMQEVWRIIEHERVHGYAHRAPNKRSAKKDDEQPSSAGSALSFNKESGKIIIQVVKIRTESFDDTKKNMS